MSLHELRDTKPIEHHISNSAAITLWKLETEEPLRLSMTAGVADLLRRSLMSKVARQHETGIVPSVVSGHSETPLNHSHATYLALDLDFDAKIDHLACIFPNGIPPNILPAVFSLRSLRHRTEQWRLLPIYNGNLATSPIELLASSRCWYSVTPWAHPWHLKKNFQIREQFLRECALNNLPPPSQIEFSEQCFVRAHSVTWKDFPPTKLGQPLLRHSIMPRFVRVQWDHKVQGPILLGTGRHTGLGLFFPG
jgi:CRISPR-associated protein Csb2